MANNRPGLPEGYLMSQAEVGALIGINQRTVCKAEKSLISKLKVILSKHGISESEFFTYLKYQEL